MTVLTQHSVGAFAAIWLLQLLGTSARLFGLPASCAGAFVTGTQIADVTALAAAQFAVLRELGWNIEEDGLAGAPPINVFVGEEVHATLLKSLRLLGFGKSQIHFVPTDSQRRMHPSLLSKLQAPAIVCAQVGNVNTGACDPVGEVCEKAYASGAWVHVDGAFGLWATTSRHRRHLLVGIERADSWATDVHKWAQMAERAARQWSGPRERVRASSTRDVHHGRVLSRP
jgi:glutamate/tyrosine decarboxylase-like PLP-dependent enzyme